MKTALTPEQRRINKVESQRRYLERNRAIINERCSKWKKNHRERVYAYARANYAKHKDYYKKVYLQRKLRENPAYVPRDLRLKLEKPKQIKKPKKPKIKPFINVQCPRCLVTGFLMKDGFHYSGRQRYRCKNCRRSFLYGDIVREPKIRVRKKDRIRLDRTERRVLTDRFYSEEKALILSTYVKQNLDSVINIPCFMCDLQEKQQCNPRACTDLDNWLYENTELKLLPIPREENLKLNSGVVL